MAEFGIPHINVKHIAQHPIDVLKHPERAISQRFGQPRELRVGSGREDFSALVYPFTNDTLTSVYQNPQGKWTWRSGKEMTMGRDPSNTIVVGDTQAQRKVSAFHGKFRGKHFFDNSRNGTSADLVSAYIPELPVEPDQWYQVDYKRHGNGEQRTMLPFASGTQVELSLVNSGRNASVTVLQESPPSWAIVTDRPDLKIPVGRGSIEDGGLVVIGLNAQRNADIGLAGVHAITLDPSIAGKQDHATQQRLQHQLAGRELVVAFHYGKAFFRVHSYQAISSENHGFVTYH